MSNKIMQNTKKDYFLGILGMNENEYLYRDTDTTLRVHAKDEVIKPKFTWYMLISTWFLLGKSPIAPGTVGSLAAYPFYYWAMTSFTSHDDVVSFLYICFVVLTILGWLSVSLFQKETKAYDHRSIVVDEVVGQLLTLAMLRFYSLGYSIFGNLCLLALWISCTSMLGQLY